RVERTETAATAAAAHAFVVISFVALRRAAVELKNACRSVIFFLLLLLFLVRYTTGVFGLHHRGRHADRQVRVRGQDDGAVAGVGQAEHELARLLSPSLLLLLLLLCLLPSYPRRFHFLGVLLDLVHLAEIVQAAATATAAGGVLPRRHERQDAKTAGLLRGEERTPLPPTLVSGVTGRRREAVAVRDNSRRRLRPAWRDGHREREEQGLQRRQGT
ncbi:unnamed protein product, partial [Ectocarpus fasciculatus]